MFIFFCISIYQEKIKVASLKYLFTTPSMIYGFKKNSQVSLKISNLTTKIVFGLATDKEIKKLNSLDSCLQYCDGQEKLIQIQFFFNQEDTSVNFQIPSKSILTPFFISCEQVYRFNYEITIINGKNHLDYRFQSMMICLLVFTIIYFISATFIIVFYFVFEKDKYEKRFLIYQISLFCIFSAIQTLLLFLEYSRKSKEEYITIDKKYEYVINLFSLLVLLDLCIFNNLNESTIFLRKKFNVSWPNIILTIIGIVSLIIVYIIGMTTSNFVSYLVCSAFYILFFISCVVSPSYTTISKIGLLLYMCGSILTFATRYCYLTFKSSISPVGIAMFNLDLTQIVFTFVAIVFFFVDYFYFHIKFYNISLIDTQENKPELINCSDDDQRYLAFEDLHGGIDQDGSPKLFYDN